MTYDDLLAASEYFGLVTKEKDLLAHDGRIQGNRVAIRRSIPSDRMKACVLAEELGHYFTSSGDIMDDSPESRKQERKAREWAYHLQVSIADLIRSKNAGCRNIYETAEYLDVPEEFLRECINRYREKYGMQLKEILGESEDDW